MRTAREVLPILYIIDIYIGAIDGAVVGALLGPYVNMHYLVHICHQHWLMQTCWVIELGHWLA